MKRAILLLIAALSSGPIRAQSDAVAAPSSFPASKLAFYDPLKIRYSTKPAAAGKVALTFEFEPKPGYVINLKPEPKLTIVKGGSSVLPKQLVPANLGKADEPNYYARMAPLTVTVDRSSDLQAQLTYFFCSKKDGFCARKTDKVRLLLP
ncbi:MAG: hypothetical protein HYX74_12365 [Acidobacteria bacterium]|nr:hypothetical protein [Acidobacteriota bacterium]